MCNFGRGHNGEHFCEIILNLDQWFRRRSSFMENARPMPQKGRQEQTDQNSSS